MARCCASKKEQRGVEGGGGIGREERGDRDGGLGGWGETVRCGPLCELRREEKTYSTTRFQRETKRSVKGEDTQRLLTWEYKYH